MADTNALTYLQLQEQVIEKRFPGSRDSVKQWLSEAYSNVWDAANWTFKHVPRATLTVASASPSLPADFAGDARVYDERGEPLQELDQFTFDDYYADPTAGTGHPEAFTVINRQLYVGPTPSSSYSFQIAYRRRLAHKNGSGATVAGYFTDDTDYPLWDDHHGILIPLASHIGLGRRSDDESALLLLDQFRAQLALMVDDYAVKVPTGTVWGERPW